MKKIIIAGGRNFQDYEHLKKEVTDCLVLWKEECEIVSGLAKGADSLGMNFAIENNLKIKEFPANWDLHGKSAGYKRNKEMAEYSDVLIAFWDGISKGTKHMINLAKEMGLKVYVFNYADVKFRYTPQIVVTQEEEQLTITKRGELYYIITSTPFGNSGNVFVKSKLKEIYPQVSDFIIEKLD